MLDVDRIQAEVGDTVELERRHGLRMQLSETTGHYASVLTLMTRFDEAWKRAQPTTFPLGMWWGIKQNWQWAA